MRLCPFLSVVVFFSAQQPKSSKTDLASLVSLAVLLLFLWWSVSAAQQPESFETDLSSSTGWGWGGVGDGVGWDDNNVHVPVRREARQPHQTRAGGGSLSLALPGGPFWPLSSPNPSKPTSPWSAWLCWLLSLWWLLLFLWWSVSAAQQPESFETDLSSSTGWGWGGVGDGVGWDDNVHVPVRREARQPRHTRAGGGSLSLALPGGPFWPLSSPNPPKPTSPTWSAWLCSLLSLWWSGLAAQQPKSSKTDLAMLVCLAVLLALPLVFRFGRSAAQILQNGPRQLGQLGCAPCSPSGGPFWPLSSPNTPKRTSPAWPAWLCSLLSLWWSVLAAQQPKSSKTDLAMLVCLGPFWKIWASQRTKRSTGERKGQRPMTLEGQGKSV